MLCFCFCFLNLLIFLYFFIIPYYIMKVKTKNLLENKFVLYLVFFLALVTVFSYIVTNNYPPVLLFLLIAILTYYFSKNMIIILGAAIVGTHVVSLINGTNIFRNNLGSKPREGFDGDKTKEKPALK